jgi:hypothetical protein
LRCVRSSALGQNSIYKISINDDKKQKLSK